MSLALIAGTGDLPDALLVRLNERPLICALSGFEPNAVPDVVFRLEHLGTFLADLRARGITQICMAGAVTRPTIDPTAIDELTMPLVPLVQSALSQGDDGAIRGTISLLESQGFDVVAAHDLAPDLLPTAGVLTSTQMSDWQRMNAKIGQACIADMGKADSGQACIVKLQEIRLQEGPDGTAAMLERYRRIHHSDGLQDPVSTIVNMASDVISDAADWLSGGVETPTTADNGILFKAPKPDQDRRADLPVIGADTAKQAAAAGLSGIVIEAGGVMVLDLDRVISTLDAQGMFLWVRPKVAS